MVEEGSQEKGGMSLSKATYRPRSRQPRRPRLLSQAKGPQAEESSQQLQQRRGVGRGWAVHSCQGEDGVETQRKGMLEWTHGASAALTQLQPLGGLPEALSLRRPEQVSVVAAQGAQQGSPPAAMHREAPGPRASTGQSALCSEAAPAHSPAAPLYPCPQLTLHSHSPRTRDLHILTPAIRHPPWNILPRVSTFSFPHSWTLSLPTHAVGPSSPVPGASLFLVPILTPAPFVFWTPRSFALRNPHLGTSLEFQWKRLCASTAGAAGSIPGQGSKIPHATQCSQKVKTK